MPEKLSDNWREALEADRKALEAKVAAYPDDEELVAGWKARIGQVDELLGVKKAKRSPKKRETKPADNGLETREG